MGREFFKNEVKETIANRATDLRTDLTPVDKDFSVELDDHDEVIEYYFTKELNPTVYENGENIKVPFMYGTPERWKSIRNDGLYRDSKGKLILPLIMCKRNNITRNDQIVFPKVFDDLYTVCQKKYTKDRPYSSIINKNNEKYYSLTLVPTYVIISYECIIWTSYIQQMNEIINKLIYAAGSYWGDKSKFRFKTQIDSFENSVDLSTDSERAVKTTFTIQLWGYILPADYNNKLTTITKITPKNVTIRMSDNLNKKIVPTETTNVLPTNSSRISVPSNPSIVNMPPSYTAEQLNGIVDGQNKTFTTNNKFVRGTVTLYINGIKADLSSFEEGEDNQTIILNEAPTNDTFIDDLEVTYIINTRE